MEETKDIIEEPIVENYPEENEEIDENELLPEKPITHGEEEAIEGTLEEE